MVELVDDFGDEVGVVGGADEAEDVFGGGEDLCDAVDDLGDGAELDALGGYGGARDVAVLAEDAAHVAVGEEDVADAAGACDGRFFAFVDANGGYLGEVGRLAEAKVLDSGSQAVAWAVGARIHLQYIYCFNLQNYQCFLSLGGGGGKRFEQWAVDWW